MFSSFASRVRSIEARTLREALERTFSFRKTHPLPTGLPEPPSAWEAPYATMTREDDLVWTTLDEVTDAARRLLDPVLASEVEEVWYPKTWSWAEHRSRGAG